MKAYQTLWLAIPLCLAGPGAVAADRQQPRPEIFNNLLKCRDIKEDSARLACFDQQVATIESAAQRDEVVVLDKTELNKTRRTLFGFSFPKLPFLGGGDDDAAKADKKAADAEDGVDRIEATIASVKSLDHGKWLIKLDDGAEWTTTEAVTFREPKPGMTIEIKRASMGSFVAKIAGRPVRVKRIG